MKQHWYAAHIIMWFKYKNKKSKKISCWENVVLLRAESGSAAWKKAEKLGLNSQDKDGDNTKYNGHPAAVTFAGVRKIVSFHEKISDGMEVTYTDLTVSSQKNLTRLVKGNRVALVYKKVHYPK